MSKKGSSKYYWKSLVQELANWQQLKYLGHNNITESGKKFHLKLEEPLTKAYCSCMNEVSGDLQQSDLLQKLLHLPGVDIESIQAFNGTRSLYQI